MLDDLSALKTDAARLVRARGLKCLRHGPAGQCLELLLSVLDRLQVDRDHAARQRPGERVKLTIPTRDAGVSLTGHADGSALGTPRVLRDRLDQGAVLGEGLVAGHRDVEHAFFAGSGIDDTGLGACGVRRAFLGVRT
jgi:hypothetical protein